MKNILSFVRIELARLFREEKGLTMVEYAVAGGLIAAVAVTAFTDLGTAVSAKIGQITTTISG